MIYETRLTIPANTPITAPVSVVLPVHPGTLTQFSLFFPKWCVELARVKVNYWEHPVFPSNPDSFFAGDDILLVFPEDMKLVDPPYEFVMYGWNLDDTYQHTITLRMQITPEDNLAASILKLFGLGPSGAVTVYGE